MSTRSTTHFIEEGQTKAIIYRHYDGYPEGHGVELQEFFSAVEAQTSDHRYNDPTYLAAKLVVWMADKFSEDAALDFLGIGVMMEDPGDIEYLYEVDCSKMDPAGRPEVRCYETEGGWDEAPRKGPQAIIPKKAATV